MTIKISTLEEKWYYRVAKVLFLIFPVFILVCPFLTGYIKFDSISLKTIPLILQKNSEYIVYITIGLISYFIILKIILGIILYIVFGGVENDTKIKSHQEMQLIPIILILVIVAIYILSQIGYIKLPKLDINSDQSITVKKHTFGTSCTSNGKLGLYGTNGICYTCSSGSNAVTNPKNSNCSNGIAGVYCCSIRGTTSGNNDNGKKTSQCIPTGCGTLWRCSGSYYIGGKQISVNGGCFPSGMRPGDIYSGWSGTCRQCP
jgi:hypothetical protein